MERRRVEKSPQAVRDLAAIAVYLAERSESEDLAFCFLDAARASFRALAAMPGMGVARQFQDPRLTGVRMWRITGFESYLIFYRSYKSGIEIIRVLHAKRDIGTLFGDRI